MPVVAPRYSIAVVYAGLFFGIGVYLPFFPVWLAGRDFDANMIGFALAVPMAVRLFTMPLGGLLADRTGRPRATLILYALGTALCFIGVALAPNAVIMLVALGLAASFWQPSLPVLDAYTMARRAEGLVDYGRVRLWGSLSFILGNIAAGLALRALSADTLIWMIVGGGLVSALAAYMLQESTLPPRPASAGTPAMPTVLKVGIAAAALVQASHALLYAFGSIRWREEGLSDTAIGLLWSVGVLAEVILFRFGTRVTARIGPERLLLLGGLAGLVRFGAMAFDPPAAVLPVLQLLHAATFGCTYLGTVELVARFAPPGRGAAIQAVAAWGIAIAMTGATLLSGPLWQAFGPLAFVFSAALAGCGAGLALLAWSGLAGQPQSAGSGG
ncbi:MFS transporter [Ancylobacter pratisalsi]|uniref:MFS transporter n=1 Tax=Ancylobacter pratisalsi TaxID=1745854 RepID=A0A6P1YPU1_9HYPH|nr:MFS transporter [Ancylobacter pratisalsi]QIB35409.1 MFS transporter [Ancylobacter pratisalsi]